MRRAAGSPSHSAVATTRSRRASALRIRVKREARGLPSIYFAHLGPEARRRTLSVLESLRRAEIPVHQSLLYDRIGEQMTRAKELAVPYVLIMGYKEAMENTILVREVVTNSQEAVPLDDLTNYLRRRRMGLPLATSRI
jgi:histidyl-tRNA synthetase